MTVVVNPESLRCASLSGEGLRDKKIIVIGSGPVGMKFVQEILQRYPLASIQVFSNEPYQPYNRVQLSSVLAGETSRDNIDLTLPSKDVSPHFSLVVSAIVSIDPQGKSVLDAEGNWHSFDYLVIATGARAHKPDVPGIAKKGVYTFRNLKDTDALYSRLSRSRHVIVMGGGLLGIEAARGLLRHGTKVTLIQQGVRLMNQQLDDTAAALLKRKVEALGITVITQSGVAEILGDDRVTGVKTRQGDIIAADTVLLCAGIRPNIKLARDARLKISNGIVVDDTLQTSVEWIFAIGECCEHRGLTYGLVSPGYEQAAVLADHLVEGSAHYKGSQTVARLKVVGENVCSMGEVEDLPYRPHQKILVFGGEKSSCYRKLVLLRGKITGAVAFGEWPEQSRIQELYQSGRRVSVWQQVMFRLTGRLWLTSGASSVATWPDSAVICQCNNIKLKTLKDALLNGADTSVQLSANTSAGTVCGSCQPLLMNLCGQKEKALKDKLWLPMLVVSVLALIVVGIVASFPPIPVSETVQQPSFLENYWNDKFWKQVTGFSLLGMSATGLLMSVKKRWLKKLLGEFTYWRLLHALLGTLCAVTLIFHTGFRLGENLNQWLMLNFLAVLGVGTLAGITMSVEFTLNGTIATRLRSFWAWLHILMSWPLPMLLAMHILTVYYF